ncbi:MAG: hypothetical protein QW085_06250 [Pyrobaculum sp.]
MRQWIVFAIVFLLTTAILLSTVSILGYGREPIYKPYWENKDAREAILKEAAVLGIRARDGAVGVVLVGYRDQIDAVNRGELLRAVQEVIKFADGYTVYILPWAIDNSTKSLLSSLYLGQLTLDDYLRGVVANATAISEKIERAYQLANLVAKTYGAYTPLGGATQVIVPPIYVAIFRNDTTYVVYEPFTLGRDSTFKDWLSWVETAFENLKMGQGKVFP